MHRYTKHKKKGVKAYLYKKSSNHTGRQQERKEGRNKGITKQPENFKNGSSKSITVTNYFNGNGLDTLM